MKKAFVLALVALMLTASGVAYAETVKGEVASVDLEGKVIGVTTTDAAGAATTSNVSVSDTTTYSGEVTALAELVEGDQVTIEATADAEGKWTATSVDVAAAE